MVKEVTGYIRVNSKDIMEKISGILNYSTCVIDEEEEDYMMVTNIDYDAILELAKDGHITQDDYFEIAMVDVLKFHLMVDSIN